MTASGYKVEKNTILLQKTLNMLKITVKHKHKGADRALPENLSILPVLSPWLSLGLDCEDLGWRGPLLRLRSPGSLSLS